MARILVIYDKWMRENAEDMWRTAFTEAMWEKASKHEFVYAENIKGSYVWSTDVVDNVKEANGNPEYIIGKVKGCDVAVSGYAPFTRDIMESSGNLKVIGISRGGPVNVDHESATAKGIKVLRAVGRNAESVADQTLGFIISESRFIARNNADIKSGKYFENIEAEGRSTHLKSYNWMELNGKTLGLIGYGQVGMRVAKRAHAFGMKVIVYDPFIPAELLEKDGCESVGLEQVISESDFVSIHAKLTPETRHMINAETLGRMKKTAVLINTARGEIIDEKALYMALKNKVIQAAALDVVEEDPIKSDNPLIELDNCTLTPHTAGRSPDTEMRGYRQVAKQVANFLEGKEIPRMYISNKAVLG
jgi:phosphoglycerate dehydrogenase-like enzyme